MTHILFDLDGTLIDPFEGISRSVKFALSTFGIHENNPANLARFIGPPLRASFMEYYDFSSAEAEEAIRQYRIRFKEKGIKENLLYPGVPEMLDALDKQGKKLYIATSKPKPFAEIILSDFGLKQYFTFIGGSGLDGSLETKGEVISHVIKNSALPIQKTVMVGDRRHDIVGAKANGLKAIGVLYGYGSKQELVQEGADYIIPTVADLSHLLLKTKY